MSSFEHSMKSNNWIEALDNYGRKIRQVIAGWGAGWVNIEQIEKNKTENQNRPFILSSFLVNQSKDCSGLKKP